MRFYICKNFPQAEKICDVCKVHGKSMSGNSRVGETLLSIINGPHNQEVNKEAQKAAIFAPGI